MFLIQLDATKFNWYHTMRFEFMFGRFKSEELGFTDIGEL